MWALESWWRCSGESWSRDRGCNYQSVVVDCNEYVQMMSSFFASHLSPSSLDRCFSTRRRFLFLLQRSTCVFPSGKGKSNMPMDNGRRGQESLPELDSAEEGA